MYGEADCQTTALPPGYNQTGTIGGNAAQQETELSSILSTLRTQANEIRGLACGIYDRVTARAEDTSCEKQAFNGNYVGRAEEVRSIQREALNLLIELSKFA